MYLQFSCCVSLFDDIYWPIFEGFLSSRQLRRDTKWFICKIIIIIYKISRIFGDILTVGWVHRSGISQSLDRTRFSSATFCDSLVPHLLCACFTAPQIVPPMGLASSRRRFLPVVYRLCNPHWAPTLLDQRSIQRCHFTVFRLAR